ncbi:DUF11 domain-containing protein [Candidatus Saccharibacteria bacterium]|nr:DUF11 domain-containing protein [Candidatus Saccharibacteria bacterium]
MSIFTKLKDIAKAVPKRAAAVLLTLTAVLVPMAIYAWGPSRTELDISRPVDYITFNSYVNNADLPWYNEFDFVRGSSAGANNSALQNDITVQEGQTYQVKMFVHNNAATWLNLVATGVKGQIEILNNGQTELRTTQQVRGWVQADNCGAKTDDTSGAYCEFWDETRFNSPNDRKFTLEYVPGSAKFVGQGRLAGSYDLPDAIISAATPLGDGVNDRGKVQGCMEYSGWVIVNVRPKFEETPNPAYDIEKKVDGKTHNAVKPGDTMTYTITAKNTGNVDLTNVKINDTLPAYYSDASETLPAGATGSIINSPHTVTIPSLAKDATATITISYTVKGEDEFECGKTTNFINRVTSSTDQKNTEDRTDNNEVDTDVTYPCEPVKTPSFDLEKKVDKATARPGETLIYTLTVKNTGEVDLTNVIVKDVLPSYIASARATTTASSAVSGDLFREGVTIAKIEVRETVTIRIEAIVKAAAQLPCGETELINKATSKTDQIETEDDLTNNEVTTTIDRKCTPPKKKPCKYNHKLEADDPNCLPPSTPPEKPHTPEYIVATGPAETAATVIGAGALTFGAVAYTRSRKDLLGKLLNK